MNDYTFKGPWSPEAKQALADVIHGVGDFIAHPNDYLKSISPGVGIPGIGSVSVKFEPGV